MTGEARRVIDLEPYRADFAMIRDAFDAAAKSMTASTGVESTTEGMISLWIKGFLLCKLEIDEDGQSTKLLYKLTPDATTAPAAPTAPLGAQDTHSRRRSR